MAFVPRTRSTLEAVDLGLSLLQAHWKPVAALWALQLGLALALCLPLFHAKPLWIPLVLWWLKPWLDRGVLFVLSRAVFRQSASLWDALGEWRNLHRCGLLATLLWRRLSPMRSYVLPIFQLEGLRGLAYRQRARVLTRQGGGTAFLLTCAGWIFTLLSLVGVIALIQAMLPPGSRLQVWEGFGTMSAPFQWFLVGVALLALTLTEPLFVAGGFGLYLNRRTHLEGWDLEQAFRRLAARLSVALSVALLLALPLSLGSLGLRAQEPPAAHPAQTEGAPDPDQASHPDQGPLRPAEEARFRAQRILREDPAFKRTEDIRALRYEPTGREPKWLRSLLDFVFGKKEPSKPATPRNLDFLKALFDLLAVVGKVLLVGSLLAFLLWLVYRFRHRLGLPGAKAQPWEAPGAIAGLDIRPESLPHDVPAAARLLFAKGEARAALALLYRAALAELVHRRGLEIPASATEGDCLRAAGGRLEPDPAATFRALTASWLRLAYKDERPSAEAFEHLCAAWPEAFRGRQ